MLGLINDNIDAAVLGDSSISDLVDSIYGGINTDVNAIAATKFDGHKIDISVRQGKKVIVLSHGHGSIYATKLLDATDSSFHAYYRLIHIAPTSSSASYTNSLVAEYFTNPNDAVINKIRSMSGMNSLASNTAAFTNDNSSSHGFIDYLKNVPSIITTFNTKKG